MKQDSHRTKLDIFVGEKERIITKRGGKSHNNKRWILNELLVSVMYLSSSFLLEDRMSISIFLYTYKSQSFPTKYINTFKRIITKHISQSKFEIHAFDH